MTRTTQFKSMNTPSLNFLGQTEVLKKRSHGDDLIIKGNLIQNMVAYDTLRLGFLDSLYKSCLLLN